MAEAHCGEMELLYVFTSIILEMVNYLVTCDKDCKGVTKELKCLRLINNLLSLS